MKAEELTALVQAALADMKAQNVVTLDVARMTSIADRIIVATGTSTRHVKSIADRVIERAKECGVKPLGVEGGGDAEWVLVDLGDVIIHIMLPTARQYYDLERLWTVDPAAAAAIRRDEA